jgi:RNA polymerase sigma factor (sigma-70 family)
MRDETVSDQAIHERLLARDPLASEEVASRYLEFLRSYVRSRGSRHGIRDEDLVNDAVVDAVFDYIRHPEKFDRTKSSLRGYLKRAAERDFINAVQKDRRHRRGQELTGDVELSILSGRKKSDIERISRDPEAESVSGTPSVDSWNRLLQGVKLPRDRRLVELMRVGERRTKTFAEVLGISHLPVSEQKRIVKQHKDRLKVQLKRTARKANG